MNMEEIFSREFELNMDNQIDMSREKILNVFYSPTAGLVVGGLYIKFEMNPSITPKEPTKRSETKRWKI